ncbi:hypothetical protein [Paraoerskovia marina]|uniref:hypothetical protein n=1 Tax=Paraoerskovia marina TaxID=545619 RepID=UPI0015614808|nr:hypothetical protein [Paraoerskovia marina]
MPQPSLMVMGAASIHEPPEYFWSMTVAAGTFEPFFVYRDFTTVVPPGAIVVGPVISPVTAGVRDAASAPVAPGRNARQSARISAAAPARCVLAKNI